MTHLVNAAKRDFPLTTPALPVFHALAKQVERIEASGGLAPRFARHAAMATQSVGLGGATRAQGPRPREPALSDGDRHRAAAGEEVGRHRRRARGAGLADRERPRTQRGPAHPHRSHGRPRAGAISRACSASSRRSCDDSPTSGAPDPESRRVVHPRPPHFGAGRGDHLAHLDRHSLGRPTRSAWTSPA